MVTCDDFVYGINSVDCSVDDNVDYKNVDDTVDYNVGYNVDGNVDGNIGDNGNGVDRFWFWPGFSQTAPTERLNDVRESILDYVCMALAGRAAEEVGAKYKLVEKHANRTRKSCRIIYLLLPT